MTVDALSADAATFLDSYRLAHRSTTDSSGGVAKTRPGDSGNGTGGKTRIMGGTFDPEFRDEVPADGMLSPG
jgi:hypothetical protein